LTRAKDYLSHQLYKELANDLDNYKALDTEVFLNLYYRSSIPFKQLKPYIEKIVDLDDDVADLLIKKKQGNMVLDLRERFTFNDQEAIEKRLIKNQNVDKFERMYEVFRHHTQEELTSLLGVYGAIL
jgi:hypothetical protein